MFSDFLNFSFFWKFLHFLNLNPNCLLIKNEITPQFLQFLELLFLHFRSPTTTDMARTEWVLVGVAPKPLQTWSLKREWALHLSALLFPQYFRLLRSVVQCFAHRKRCIILKRFKKVEETCQKESAQHDGYTKLHRQKKRNKLQLKLCCFIYFLSLLSLTQG